MNRGLGGSPDALRSSPERPERLPGTTSPPEDQRQETDHALLRTLIDQVPDLLFVKDLGSRFVLANNAAAHEVGQASPEDLIGKTDLDFYEEPQARMMLQQEHDIMFNGLSFVDVEERGCDRSAGERWRLATKLPLRNDAGEVIGLVGCCRDITARKREERLQEGEAAILERIAGSADLVDVLDPL